MLALALFSLEAGLAHIAIARDHACQAELQSLRVAPPEGSECMSELALAAMNALARGPAGALPPKAPALASWLLSGAAYAVLGGACAQLTTGRGIGVYLLIHGFLLAASAFLSYILPHMTM